ncbi:unnamed protein product [Ectocarpus sp. 4 AP-2014]
MTDAERAQLIEQQQAELRGCHGRDFEDIAAVAAAGGDGAGGITAPPTAGEVHAKAERAVQRAQAVEVEARGAKWVARVQQYKSYNAGVSLEEAVHRVWESYVNSFYLYHPDTTPAPASEPPAWFLGAIAASTTSPRYTWAQLEAASPGSSPPEETAAPQPPVPFPVVAGPTPRRYQHIRHGASSSSSPQGSPPVAAAAAAPPAPSTTVAAATSHKRYQYTRHGRPPSPPMPLPATAAVARDAHQATASTTAHQGHRATAAASTNSGHAPPPPPTITVTAPPPQPLPHNAATSSATPTCRPTLIEPSPPPTTSRGRRRRRRSRRAPAPRHRPPRKHGITSATLMSRPGRPPPQR